MTLIREEKEKEVKTVLDEIMAENFQIWRRKHIQVKEAESPK